eukprot:Gb_16233 [translate_table: standard]
MEMGMKRCSVFVGMVLVVLCCGGRDANAAEDSTSCVSSLTPCAGYLNSTNPPASCCTPLLKAIKTQQQCLCGLLNSSAIAAFGINLTQALELPQKCGANANANACQKVGGGASTSNATTPSKGSSSNNTNSKSDSNAAPPRLPFLGISGLIALLLFGTVSGQAFELQL